MNGIEFGKELKKIRTNVKYPTKTLSTKVGKSTAYVSQLERGLIKNPDYDTCHELLKELSFPKEKIEDFLYTFGIMSDERKKIELEQNIKYEENLQKTLKDTDEEFLKYHYPYLFDDEHDITSLKASNRNIFNVFDTLIEKDFTRAEKVIRNISNLTKSKKSFDFLCSILKHDFFNITASEKEEIIKLIKNFNMSKDEIFDWEEE